MGQDSRTCGSRSMARRPDQPPSWCCGSIGRGRRKPGRRMPARAISSAWASRRYVEYKSAPISIGGITALNDTGPDAVREGPPGLTMTNEGTKPGGRTATSNHRLRLDGDHARRRRPVPNPRKTPGGFTRKTPGPTPSLRAERLSALRKRAGAGHLRSGAPHNF